MRSLWKNFKFPRLRLDENIFFERELETVRAGDFEIKYAPLKGLQLVPVNTSIDPADETYTVRVWDGTGTVKLISSYANDFPRADVFASESSVGLKSYGNGYGYSIQEIRRARRANKPLEAKKRGKAKQAMDQKLDKLVQLGDPAVAGSKGLLNQSGTLTYTLPADGTGSSKVFTTKTPDQIVRDLHAICNAMITTTSEVEVPNTMLLPLTTYYYVSTTRMSAGDGTLTILQTFMAQRDDIKTVVPWAPLETAGASSTKRIVVYRRAPDVLEFLLAVPFEEFPPQAKGMEFEIACHMRTGFVVVYLPAAIIYSDGC